LYSAAGRGIAAVSSAIDESDLYKSVLILWPNFENVKHKT